MVHRMVPTPGFISFRRAVAVMLHQAAASGLRKLLAQRRVCLQVLSMDTPSSSQKKRPLQCRVGCAATAATPRHNWLLPGVQPRT